MQYVARLLILLLLSLPAWAEETISFEELMARDAQEAAQAEEAVAEAKQLFNLEGLMTEGKEHPAPPALRAHLEQDPALQEDMQAVREYVQGYSWIEEDFESIFAATPITLSSTGHPVYIVYPSTYCPVFVGAHAIGYWIMEQQPDGTYRNLLSGATDIVLVLDAQTLGYQDLATVYGLQYLSLYRFDGTTYQYVSDPAPTKNEPPDPAPDSPGTLSSDSQPTGIEP